MTENVNTVSDSPAADAVPAPTPSNAGALIAQAAFGLGLLVFAAGLAYTIVVATSGNTTVALVVAIVVVVAILASGIVRRARAARAPGFDPADFVDAPRPGGPLEERVDSATDADREQLLEDSGIRASVERGLAQSASGDAAPLSLDATTAGATKGRGKRAPRKSRDRTSAVADGSDEPADAAEALGIK